MTIAACHLSPEGVVLGADSASTLTGGPNGTCHLDYAQKVFEVGPPGSSVGLVTWGMGQVGAHSHRTIAADLGFQNAHEPFGSMRAMAEALAKDVWRKFSDAHADHINRAHELLPDIESGTATHEEQEELAAILRLAGGYCLAGRIADHGLCEAFTVLWSPLQTESQIDEIPSEVPVFWGVPDIMQRLVYGYDATTLNEILSSGKWSGTEAELLGIIVKYQLISPKLLPIREAVDWVHTVIHTTIRGTKFANWPHWCGGPVEIAVITTDRPFRWVRHKKLDAAIVTAEEARQ